MKRVIEWVCIAAVSIFLSVVIIHDNVRAAGMEMFEPPNSQAKVLYKYFNGNRNFIFCWMSYDLPSRKFKDSQMCIRKDKDAQRVFIDLNEKIVNSDDMEITIRYNTLDRGLVDKVYEVAPGESGRDKVFIVNPEDVVDVANALTNSRDVIVFYKTDNSDNYSLMYFPMPIRNVDGTVPMVEAETK